MYVLEPTDDYLVHYPPPSLQAAPEAYASWFDHTEMMIVSPDSGAPIINSYFQVTPHQGFLQGFTLVSHDDRQYNLRACKEVDFAEHLAGGVNYGHSVRGDRYVSTDLPGFAQVVVKPFEAWQVTMGKNPNPVVTEISCRATTPPMLCPRIEQPITTGTGFHTAQEHMVQLFQVTSGTLTIERETWDLTGWQGWRDHCWGYRLPRAEGNAALHTWMPAFFPSRRLVVLRREDAARRPTYSFAQIVGETRSDSYTQMKVQFTGPRLRPVPEGVTWDFENEYGRVNLKTGQIDPAASICFSGGWDYDWADRIDSMAADYYRPYRVESDMWPAGVRREVAGSGGLKALTRYRVDLELDGERGFGALACFSAPADSPV